MKLVVLYALQGYLLSMPDRALQVSVPNDRTWVSASWRIFKGLPSKGNFNMGTAMVFLRVRRTKLCEEGEGGGEVIH
jgi:hypothetical protein